MTPTAFSLSFRSFPFDKKDIDKASQKLNALPLVEEWNFHATLLMGRPLGSLNKWSYCLRVSVKGPCNP
jgi:hypothetical protein